MEYATAICQALLAIPPYAEVQSRTLSVSGDQHGGDGKVYDSQVACPVNDEIVVDNACSVHYPLRCKRLAAGVPPENLDPREAVPTGWYSA